MESLDEPAEPRRRAVVIDDDPDVRHLLLTILEGAGFEAVSASNGAEGIAAVRAAQPAITTLDVTMPGMDGFETARRIREFSDTYLIMVTALDGEADAVLGFGAGADDVVYKPFRPRELRARIEAMLRRPRFAGDETAAAERPDHAEDPHTLAFADLVVDVESREVRQGGRELTLTRSEFDLLAALLQTGRRVRTRSELVLLLRGDPDSNGWVSDADQRALESHIANLRRKLGDSPTSPRYIETVRGIGYRARAEDQ
jgi:two-component system OmpR family response regulator